MKDKSKNILKIILAGVLSIGLVGASVGIIKSLKQDHQDYNHEKSISINVGENYVFSKVGETKTISATINNKDVDDKLVWESNVEKIKVDINTFDSTICTLTLNEELSGVATINVYLVGHEDVNKKLYCSYVANPGGETIQPESCNHLNTSLESTTYGEWIHETKTHKRAVYKNYKCLDCNKVYRVESGFETRDCHFNKCDGTLAYYTIRGSERGVWCPDCQYYYNAEDGHLISEYSEDGKCVMHKCDICIGFEEHVWTLSSIIDEHIETTWGEWKTSNYEEHDHSQHKHNKHRYGTKTTTTTKRIYECSDCESTKVEGGITSSTQVYEDGYDLENHNFVSKVVGEECGATLVWFPNQEVRGVKCPDCGYVYTYDDSQTASTGSLTFYGNKGLCNQVVNVEHQYCEECGYSE